MSDEPCGACSPDDPKRRHPCTREKGHDKAFGPRFEHEYDDEQGRRHWWCVIAKNMHGGPGRPVPPDWRP